MQYTLTFTAAGQTLTAQTTVQSGTEPTGPTLNYATLTLKPNATNPTMWQTIGNPAIGTTITYPAGTFETSDFQANKYAGAIQTRGVAGYYGLTGDRAATTLQMKPNTSTHAADDPPQYKPDGTWNQGVVNNLALMRLGGTGNDSVPPGNLKTLLANMTIKGTPQGHLYNGVVFQWANDSVCENVLFKGIEGTANAEPDETYSVGVYRSERCIFRNIECDGRNDAGVRVGSTQVGVNGVTQGFTMEDSYLHDTNFGAGIAIHKCNGPFKLIRVRSVHHLIAAFNFEGCTGTAELDHCDFTDAPWAHIIADSWNIAGSLKMTITDPIFDGPKLRITVHDTATQQQNLNDIILIKDGVVRNDLIQFQRNNAVGEGPNINYPARPFTAANGIRYT